MQRLLRPCVTCGELTERTYCSEHRPRRVAARTDTSEWAWMQLAQRAKRLQPFCGLCGATSDLQADHSPRAWARVERGKAIRLQDITVLCRTCNNRAGSSKRGSYRFGLWLAEDGDIDATTPDLTHRREGEPNDVHIRAESKFRTQSPRGYR